VFDRSIENFLDQGIRAEVVKAGDRLEPFTLDDATGTAVSLDQIVEAGPAVIVFYWGGWCPYCNLRSRQECCTLPCCYAASLGHGPVAFDPPPNLVWVFSGIVQSDADEPGVQVRLGAKEADSLFLAALEFLQARDDLPDVRAAGERRAPVMRGAAEDDFRVVKLVGALNDELIEQCCDGHALASGAGCQASPGSVADPERCTRGHGDLLHLRRRIPQCSAHALRAIHPWSRTGALWQATHPIPGGSLN
jgi:hypothetical protein